MPSLRIFPFALLVLSLSGAGQLRSEETNSAGPEFNEVYNLVREHLPGASNTELTRAAVQGLVSRLGPKVTLVGPETAATGAERLLVSRTNVLDGQIAYLRISRVAEGLAVAVRQAYNQLGASNDLNGLILDLRYTGGTDYAAAAATADLFQPKERPLLDWGKGMVQSKEKVDAVTVPVAVMVNHETTGAAEALAGALRQTGTALVFGGRTAGLATVAQEYPLKSGERLRIATSPVHLGDGSEIPSEGLKPDILVTVAAPAERSYFEDAFKDPATTNLLVSAGRTGTNRVATTRTRRPRFNEAELVRERRDGYNPDNEVTNADAEPEPGIVRDPVLARAVDVLKGLAVVRRTHS